MERTDFMHVDTDSQKLNTDQIFLSGCSQKWEWPVMRIQNWLYLKNEQME